METEIKRESRSKFLIHEGFVPCEAAHEVYYVHAGDCDKGLSEYSPCSCGFNGRYDGETNNGGVNGHCGVCDEEIRRRKRRRGRRKPRERTP